MIPDNRYKLASVKSAFAKATVKPAFAKATVKPAFAKAFVKPAFAKATAGKKKWQADYIAPLNRLLLLPSGPGRVQQELVV